MRNFKCNYKDYDDLDDKFDSHCGLRAIDVYTNRCGDLICRCKEHSDNFSDLPVWVQVKSLKAQWTYNEYYDYTKLTDEEMICFEIMQS